MVSIGFRAAARSDFVEASDQLWRNEAQTPGFKHMDAMTVVFAEVCARLADYVGADGSLNVGAGDSLFITQAELLAVITGMEEPTSVDVDVLADPADGHLDLEIRMRLQADTIWATLELPAVGSSGWWVSEIFLEKPLDGPHAGGMEKLRGHVVGRAKDTSLEAARFRLPDGREKAVAIVHRPAAVAVVPLRVREGGGVEVLLVRQPRPAVGEPALVEIVAGKVDGDEDPLTTAQRELGEEAGLQAEVWHELATGLLPAPGFLNEPIHLFAAHGLTAVASRAQDAHITGEWVLLADAVRMVLSGEIRDMKARDAVLAVDKLHHDWPLA